MKKKQGEQIWTARERGAWKPAPKLSAAAWAERHRFLTAEQTSRPGPWRNRNAPHVIGILSLLTWRYVREVAVLKAGQTSVSEALRCWLAYVAHTEPAPYLYVMPDEKTGRRQVEKHYLPLFRDTPALSELLSERLHDVKMSSISLRNGFRMDLAFAKSTAQMKSDPYRYAAVDEADECPATTVEKVRIRLTTYAESAKLAIVSTPKGAGGQIVKAFDESAVKLYPFCPCPHCGTYQRLLWERLEWEGKEPEAGRPGATDRQDAGTTESEPKRRSARELAAWLQHSGRAWYTCGRCDERITERQKVKMLRRGVAVTETLGPLLKVDRRGARTPDGFIIPFGDTLPVGERKRAAYVRIHWPPGRTVGVRVWKIHAIETRFAEIAGAYLRSKDDHEELAEFHEQWLGEVYTHEIVAPKPSMFEQKCRVPWPEGEVPAWAVRLIATADVHAEKKGLYVVVRGWAAGPQLRSRRIWHGVVADFDALRLAVFGHGWPVERDGGARAVELLCIDRRYRTEEVDAFCRRDATRCKGLEGVPTPQVKWATPREGQYTPPGQKRPQSAYYFVFDANRTKDWVAAALLNEVEWVDPETKQVSMVEQWELNNRDDRDYNRQMSAESKRLEKRGGRLVEVWDNPEGRANHYWDCESMQRVAAFLAKVEQLGARRTIVADYRGRGKGKGSSAWKIGR